MSAQEYEWNPPVGCPLVVLVDDSALRCERTTQLQDKAGQVIKIHREALHGEYTNHGAA